MIRLIFLGREFTYNYKTEKWTRITGEPHMLDHRLEYISVSPHEFMVDAIRRALGDKVEILSADPEDLEDVREEEELEEPSKMRKLSSSVRVVYEPTPERMKKLREIVAKRLGR